MTKPEYKPASTLTTRFDSELLFKLKALAWWKRTTQRDILEQGLEKILADMEPDELNRALAEYEKQQSDDG